MYSLLNPSPLPGNGQPVLNSLTPQWLVTGEAVFTFSDFSRPVSWSDLTISLTDGADTVSWSPNAEELDGGMISTVSCQRTLGELALTCRVTDNAGDGTVGNGDWIKISPGHARFSKDVVYTINIVYEPTGASLFMIGFTGWDTIDF